MIKNPEHLDELIESYISILTHETRARYNEWLWNFDNEPEFQEFILNKHPQLQDLEPDQRLKVFKVLLLEMLSVVHGTVFDEEDN